MMVGFELCSAPTPNPSFVIFAFAHFMPPPAAEFNIPPNNGGRGTRERGDRILGGVGINWDGIGPKRMWAKRGGAKYKILCKMRFFKLNSFVELRRTGKISDFSINFKKEEGSGFSYNFLCF
jgi:hypothetical protein